MFPACAPPCVPHTSLVTISRPGPFWHTWLTPNLANRHRGSHNAMTAVHLLPQLGLLAIPFPERTSAPTVFGTPRTYPNNLLGHSLHIPGILLGPTFFLAPTRKVYTNPHLATMRVGPYISALVYPLRDSPPGDSVAIWKFPRTICTSVTIPVAQGKRGRLNNRLPAGAKVIRHQFYRETWAGHFRLG